MERRVNKELTEDRVIHKERRRKLLHVRSFRKYVNRSGSGRVITLPQGETKFKISKFPTLQGEGIHVVPLDEMFFQCYLDHLGSLDRKDWDVNSTMYKLAASLVLDLRPDGNGSSSTLKNRANSDCYLVTYASVKDSVLHDVSVDRAKAKVELEEGDRKVVCAYLDDHFYVGESLENLLNPTIAKGVHRSDHISYRMSQLFRILDTSLIALNTDRKNVKAPK